MLRKSLTSVKQSTKLSCYHSCEHDTHDMTVKEDIQQGRAPPLHRATRINACFLITVCFIASHFTSCVSLHLLPKIKRTFLTNETSGFSSFEITLLPREAAYQTRWTEARLCSKSPSPWWNSSPAHQFCAAVGSRSPTYPRGRRTRAGIHQVPFLREKVEDESSMPTLAKIGGPG